MRRRTRAFFSARKRPSGRATWSGSGTGATRSAPWNCIEFLIQPLEALPLAARVHGVRYPEDATRALADAGIEYAGWLPNFRVPEVFARFRLTLHIPRLPYTRALPGIPTIRPFEALACGIPLISRAVGRLRALFTPGADYLVARDGQEMTKHIKALLHDKGMAREVSQRTGSKTILARHTCAHRVDELLAISPANCKPHEHRLFRLQPGLRVLERRGDLLPRHHPRAGCARPSRHLLRTGCLRAAEPSRPRADPPWARVVVYPATEEAVRAQLEQARGADVIVKASGVGVFDELLEAGVAALKSPANTVIFWDVDAPATLERVEKNPADPFRALIPEFDFIFTYGGGEPVVAAYRALGAQECVPIYNALDPATHFPVPPEPRFDGELAFLGNRLPDREARVDEFFFAAARLCARRPLSPRRQWLARQAAAAQRARPRPPLHARSQRL